MLRGTKVGLRARQEADIAILHAELYDDVEGHSRSDARPWRPVTPGSAASPYAIKDPEDRHANFSVVTLDGDELVGEAVLWGIDTHNRFAHLGLALLPAWRGKGLGVDIVRVLCHYGFVVRGLHRLQIETLTDNAAMRRAAERAGFVHEGTMRSAAWVVGEFIDEVIYGLLDADYGAPPAP